MILKEEMINRTELYQRWKKYNAIKDKNRPEALLKFMQRIYNNSPELQEVMDLLMIEVCAEENVPPEHVFFYIAIFCCCLYHNDYSRKKI